MLLPSYRYHSLWIILAAVLVTPALVVFAQSKQKKYPAIDVSPFIDSKHHWYDVTDDEQVITPLPGQKQYSPREITHIADNILLFQKFNGGWPKNYDMLAILADEQKEAVLRARNDHNTTFDNGATHAQVEYLARVYSVTKENRYKEACLKGIDFILSAQYPTGGWPQFFPDTSGYRKHITFNDGAMVGVMNVLRNIVQREPHYALVDDTRREQVHKAFEKGLDCIVKSQIVQNGRLTGWGQQHDNVDLRPRGARSYELASIAGQESAEIVLFLMSIDKPSRAIIRSVQSAVEWFRDSRIYGIRCIEVASPHVKYQFHAADFDRVVVSDPEAPPIWTRLYELGTNRPMFCNRDGKPVYSLAEVDRERRTGYAWYTYAPDEVLKKYPDWLRKKGLSETTNK